MGDELHHRIAQRDGQTRRGTRAVQLARHDGQFGLFIDGRWHEPDTGKRFVQLVRELVQDIVEGDFDQIEVYEQKLSVLENFIVEQSRREVQEQAGAPSLLAQKETDLRLQQRYTQQLQALLQPLPMTEFVRDFITQVWSQALMRATRLDGADSARVKRFRHAGRELIMSVQPKGSPEQRKAFLMQLPTLMKELNEGMDLIGWPEGAKKSFFGQLLPAHAESLKGQSLRTLDYNLLVRQADLALGEAAPDASELPPPQAHLPVLRDEVATPAFSAWCGPTSPRVTAISSASPTRPIGTCRRVASNIKLTRALS